MGVTIAAEGLLFVTVVGISFEVVFEFVGPEADWLLPGGGVDDL